MLNLAANSIQKFEEIKNLQNLPRLKYLCFKDPQYGENPLTTLCNYSLYVMYLLPGLAYLDTFQIGQKAVKEFADVMLTVNWHLKFSTSQRLIRILYISVDDKQEETLVFHEADDG